jgi:hypothetical protein
VEWSTKANGILKEARLGFINIFGEHVFQIFENENYILFEHSESEGDFLPMTDDKKFWKILPFEILYSKKILDIDIDKKLTHFFKQFPDLLCININKIYLNNIS